MLEMLLISSIVLKANRPVKHHLTKLNSSTALAHTHTNHLAHFNIPK